MQARMTNPAFVRARRDGRRCRRSATSATAGRRPARARSTSCTCGPARSTAAACASTCTPGSCKQAGETDERIFAVAAWRETPYFTDAERAALALTEA